MGGRMQATGAELIFKAERGEIARLPLRFRVCGAMAAAAAILLALWVLDASAGLALPGATASHQAGAGAF